MPALLTLSLLGPLRIQDADGDELATLSLRGRALLAYLADQPGMRAERGLLADLLWSERAEEQARASLRQELALLRKALPDAVLMANRQSVWLDPTRIILKRSGSGEFLQGFDLPSEGFEDWLRRMRATERPAQPEGMPLPETARRHDRPVLAILPFDELGVPESDMFADGVVEEITNALSRVHEFHVIARQSAFALRDNALSVPDAATRLGADYIIEGSVRRAGDRVRISVQLVRGTDGHTLWSERFDDQLNDLFDLQDRIASQVAGQISPNLRAAEILRARTTPPADRSAYELLLSAMPHFWVHDPDENRAALALLDTALTRSPGYVPALAMKAWCHAHECCYHWSMTPEISRAAARAAFDAALPNAQSDPAALTALSAAAALALRDFKQAEDLAHRALALDPNNAWGWMRLGWTSTYLNQSDTAFECFDKAEALSPLDPFMFNINFGRASTLRTLRHFDDCIALIEKGLRAAPRAHWAYRMLFGTYWLNGEEDKAIEAGRKWIDSYPDLSTEVLLAGLPDWGHDPDYINLLARFKELLSNR